MKMFNDDLVERAQAIADRKGGVWQNHILAARKEAHIQPLQKLVKRTNRRDEALRKRARLSRHRHQMPGIGNPDPDRRLEISDCETSVGRVHVQIERDSLTVHGISTLRSDLPRDLDNALTASSAAFFAAETDEEQTDQRNLIAVIIDGVLRRNKFLDAKVSEALTRQRFDV
jgi:hypothetical protein